jgi:hypothetical protein
MKRGSTTPVSLEYLKTARGSARVESYATSLKSRPLIVSEKVAFRLTIMLLKTCTPLEFTVLPTAIRKRTQTAGVAVKETKERINRWRAYQQLFIELMSRASEWFTDGNTRKYPRYVVFKTPSGLHVAFSLWSRNAIYVSRWLSTLKLTKKQARDKGAWRICRRGAWREALLGLFERS